jgi:protoheme ferro-lyase
MKKEIEGNPKEAVLLLAHGTPDVLGEIEEYLKACNRWTRCSASCSA